MSQGAVKALCLAVVAVVSCASAGAQVTAPASALFLDGLATNDLRLFNGAKWTAHSNGARLEFNTAIQYGEVPLSQLLDGVQEMTIGGWFFPRRSGEQYFLFRGTPETGAQG